MKTIKILKNILIIIFMSVMVVGCFDQSAPVSPISINQPDLNFITLPQHDNSLMKIITVSDMISVANGGSIELKAGPDPDLIEKINNTPSNMATWRLAQHLFDAIPLSPTVLSRLTENPALQNDFWINFAIGMNGGLRECVLNTILDNQSITSSWQLRNILILSSPLPNSVFNRLDNIGLSSYDKQKVLQAQNGVRPPENTFNTGGGGLSVSLEILPGAISTDSDISITADDQQLSADVYLTFGPHGTQFNPSAILNVEASGLDLTGIDPAAINIYYDNQDTGNWEPMPRDDLIVNVMEGYIKVVNARLPHFSRYAVAYGR